MPADHAEAGRRIEAARRDQSIVLDLSGLRLRSVPDEVAGLSHLRELKLNDNRLRTLPESLANLTGLTHLNLEDNWLGGVPDWMRGLRDLTWLDLDNNQIIDVPAWIGDLANLTHLGLNKCDLDTVPDWIRGLVGITELGLGDNFLGEVPAWVGDLTGLKRLQLYGNRLHDLPDSLARLSSLGRLELDNNRLREVPEWISRLSGLAWLDIGGNEIARIPAWLGDLTSLTRLDLASSRLAEVPDWLSRLTNLTELYMESNWLDEIPEWLGELKELIELRLDGNRLPTLPWSLARLTKLTRLHLGQNRLIEVPDWIGQLPDLTQLDLSGNQFAQVPDWLGSLTALTVLGMNNCRLEAVPEWVANLTKLTVLGLNGNELAKTPDWLGNLTGLTTLTLSDNRLRALPASLAGLTKLTRLDLNRNRLTEVPNWIEQCDDLTWLDLGNNQFSRLPDTLGRLTGLKHLVIAGCEVPSRPEWLANLRSLTWLDLSGNQLTEVPPEVEALDRLTTLILSDNRLTGLPDWLAGHSRVTRLYLASNRFKQVPEPVHSLARLQALNLINNDLDVLPRWLAACTRLNSLYASTNRMTALPDDLAALTGLSSLVLSDNRLTALPSWLASMTDLTVLHLGGNQFNGLPDWIGKLDNLEFLDIGDCQLIEVPSWVSGLANLQYLNLGTNKISSIPEALRKLAALTTFSLPGNKVSELPGWLGDLTEIETLSVSGNELTALPDSISELSRLKYLDLASNRLATISPGLARAKSLERLYLRDNKLVEAPDWLLDLPVLKTLTLADNPTMVSPPPEIAASGTESIIAFLKARREGASRQWMSKLLVVGEGGVGKTSLINALRGMEHDPTEATTHGIRIDNLIVQHPEHDDVRMRLSAWDFGGQEIYHATHQFFLTDRSLFVLLWNSRLGWEQGKLHYWLDIIKSRAPESPVLIVATHAEANERPVDLPLDDLRREYPRIVGHLTIDNETRTGIKEVRERLARLAADLPLMGAEWPTAWLAAADAVRASPGNHIPPGEMWRLMTDAGVTDPAQQRYIAVAMHQLGDILYYHDDPELEQTVVLRPEWVNEYISKVLDSPAVDQANGLLGYETMTELWSELDRGMRDHFLGMMDKYEISFRVEGGPGGAVSMVVERLPWNPPALDGIWDDAPDEDGTSRIKVVYQLNTTPPGIPTWFIARFHRYSTNTHWRTGAVLRSADGKHTAMLRAYPRANRVELTVRGPSPAAFFLVLDEGFNRTLDRYPGLEIKRMVPCPCRDHDGEQCPELFDYATLSRRLERTPPRHEIECHRSETLLNVPQLLLGLAPSERDAASAEIARLRTMIENSADKIESSADKLAELAADSEYIQRLLLKLCGLIQRQQETRCPSVFAIVPVKSRLAGTVNELRLYCEEPGAWHPLPEPDGRYPISEPAEWLRKIAPHLKHLLTVMKHAAPLAGPVLGMSVAHVSDHLKAEMEAMTKLVDQIPEPSGGPGLPGEEGRDPDPMVRAETDADFRALEALLLKLDPDRVWGGLSRTVTPEGLTLYLCREHSEPYRRAVRLQPSS